MRKLMIIVLILAFTISLAACSTTVTTSATTTVETQKKVLIGVALSSTDTFMMQVLKKIQATAADKGAEVTYTNADNDIQKQLADVESLIAKKCDVIIIRALDAEGLVPAAEACAAAGIPLIDIGNGINSDKLTENVMLGQYAGGVLIANEILKLLNDKPELTLNVGYLWGWKGIPIADERYNGIFDTLKPMMDAGRVKILDEQLCDWDVPKAMNASENWLQKYPAMNCIIAQGDQMALGAANVLNAINADFNNWYVIGFDLRDLYDSIAAGEAFASVYMNADVQAQFATEEAIRIANGGKVEEKIIDLAKKGLPIWELVTRENIKNFPKPAQ